MSGWWAEDARWLREHAETQEGYAARRLREIAHDMDNAQPDADWLEELGKKIEGWVEQRVLPTPAFAEELAKDLRAFALVVKKCL